MMQQALSVYHVYPVLACYIVHPQHSYLEQRRHLILRNIACWTLSKRRQPRVLPPDEVPPLDAVDASI